MKSPENQDHLRACRHFLSSLSDSVPAVLSFRGRWSAIADKLDRLRAALSDLSDLPHPDTNPLSADLLRSLSHALAATLDLSLRCHSPDPPSGKLRTQSDLAAAAATLDQHLADADLLLLTGALLDPPRPPALPAPHPPGSRRELVRVEARNLVTRLQIGGAASKNAALGELIGLLQEDDKNVLIAAAQGAVPALVRLLDSPCLETKEKAVAAISRVSSVESCRHVLVAEGVPLLNHLARVLEYSGAGAAKEKACLALQALTLTKENARAFGGRGGVCSLLEICQAGTPSSQAAAAGVLKNLAAIEEIRPAFSEEAAVPVLVRLCSSGTAAAQENVVACLRNLAAGEGHDLKLLIFREAGADCLKNYWDGGDGRNLEPAAGLLRNLASCKPIAEHLLAAGFAARAVAALGNGSAATRTEAARAVHELAQGSSRAAKEMGEAGCIPRLVRMTEAKGSEEKEAAVMALASLLAATDNRRVFRKDDRGIMNVVQLLDPLLPSVNKKHPIAVLASVSQSRKCRKRMVEAGACGFLQRLVDMEVEGARRLLDTLGKGKLWGVFTRT